MSRFTVLILAVLAGIGASAEAAPVQWGVNGHYYDFIYSPGISWFTARDDSAASTYLGNAGYLATITSQAENDFLRDLALSAGPFSGFNGAWIAGKDPEGWLTGPETGNAFTYTNWGGIEPNNDGYVYMSIGTSGPDGIVAGQWLDDSGTQGIPSPADPVIGYFVEYSETTSVPEPSMVALLGISSAGFWFAKRRNARRATLN